MMVVLSNVERNTDCALGSMIARGSAMAEKPPAVGPTSASFQRPLTASHRSLLSPILSTHSLA